MFVGWEWRYHGSAAAISWARLAPCPATGARAGEHRVAGAAAEQQRGRWRHPHLHRLAQGATKHARMQISRWAGDGDLCDAMGRHRWRLCPTDLVTLCDGGGVAVSATHGSTRGRAARRSRKACAAGGGEGGGECVRTPHRAPAARPREGTHGREPVVVRDGAGVDAGEERCVGHHPIVETQAATLFHALHQEAHIDGEVTAHRLIALDHSARRARGRASRRCCRRRSDDAATRSPLTAASPAAGPCHRCCRGRTSCDRRRSASTGPWPSHRSSLPAARRRARR